MTRVQVEQRSCDQGPHARSFLARINNENFLRGANERNTRLRQEGIFARASEALRVGSRHFRSLMLGSIAKYNWSKKTSHFPRQLNQDFEALFKRTRNFFVRNLIAKC